MQAIKTILVVPYSPLICAYYINDGERHATTYEKVNEMLTRTTPNLCYKILEKMSRHLPFFIDVDAKTLSEVKADIDIDDFRAKYLRADLTLTEEKETIKFQKRKERIFANILDSIRNK